MFGFNLKKVKKVNLREITEVLSRRQYEVEAMPAKDIVVLKTKYVNQGKQFEKLYLHFVGENVSFKDVRGNYITQIPKAVPITEMYPHILNIIGVPSN